MNAGGALHCVCHEAQTMPAGQLVQPSQTEEAFVLQALQSAALRADGRKFAQARPVNIKFGEQLGSCEVSIGDTMYVLFF